MEKRTTVRKQGNMALADDNGNANSEPKINLETMRKYISQHFARMQETWEIECIPNEIWACANDRNEPPNNYDKHTQRHNKSIMQQYSNTSQQRKQQIDQMEKEITHNEITKAIQKLNNRKSVGKDQITAEIIKENQDWVTPILQKLLNGCNKRNAMPKSWLGGVVTFLRKKRNR